MPRIEVEDDVASEPPDDAYEDAAAEVDTKAKNQLNGELKDKIAEHKDDDEDDDEDDEPVLTTAQDDEGDEEDPDAKGQEEEDEAEDEEGVDAGEFNVEAIRSHRFVKGDLFYHIKWQGYPDKDNTWEPEEHLLPHSRAILIAYHKKIGGVPQAPIKRGKSKQGLRQAASSENLPAPKRQKRNGASESGEAGSWLPKGDNWEDQVDKVEMIERNEETNQLMAFILFNNGKRTKMTMDMVYQHCPRPMLKFYEANLKFK